MNQWPGVKLRVTEGWDEEGKHATDSLHYEGRAVDVTTSDRDRSKYGMLARLAVEAGFDWVYYESRSHIHCSVKTESSSVGKSGGCFPGKSTIITSTGESKSLSSLRLGEKIASIDANGEVVYSEVIAFLDRSPAERRQFIKLTTKSGRTLTLTPSHLIPIGTDKGSTTIFAAKVKVNDRILVRDYDESLPGSSRLRWDSVINAKLVLDYGVYAPLTREGTVLIDNVVASCYAIVNSQTIAHYAFLPMRITASISNNIISMKNFIFNENNNVNDEINAINGAESNDSRYYRPIGINWYADLLYTISTFILPNSMLY